MRLSELFDGQNIQTDIEIAGLTADSRKVEPGYVFAALSGVARDGRDFVEVAQVCENRHDKKGQLDVAFGRERVPRPQRQPVLKR